MVSTKFEPHKYYNCIDEYVEPSGDLEWMPCPRCGLKPRVWLYDNGRATACGCWEGTYRHFSVYAESVMSVHRRTGGTRMNEYDVDGLRKNWNHWCETGEVLFVPRWSSELGEGKW